MESRSKGGIQALLIHNNDRDRNCLSQILLPLWGQRMAGEDDERRPAAPRRTCGGRCEGICGGHGALEDTPVQDDLLPVLELQRDGRELPAAGSRSHIASGAPGNLQNVPQPLLHSVTIDDFRRKIL